MKKITLTLVSVIFSILIFAQSPQGFKYQAVYRDNSGNIISNQNIAVQIKLLQDSITGAVVFEETHNTATNDFGLFNIVIGSVNPTDFATIDWANGSYFVNVILNGTDYGTSQLLSVPYALCANSVSFSSPNGDRYNYNIDNYGNVSLKKVNATPLETLVERLTYIYNNLESTRYVHSADSVMNEYTGVYDYDCSGFVCEFAIKRCLSKHYQDLYDHKISSRPLARDFYDYFRDTILGSEYDSDDASTCTKQTKYWKVFTNIDSVKKGDLVIARYDDEWREAEDNSTTGHVMVAWGSAIQDEANPDIYTLKIYDAAGSPHSKDSRDGTPSASTDGSGVGIGYMIFKASTSASHRPVQYLWKTTSSMFYKSYAIYYDSSHTDNERSHERLKGIIFARPIN